MRDAPFYQGKSLSLLLSHRGGDGASLIHLSRRWETLRRVHLQDPSLRAVAFGALGRLESHLYPGCFGVSPPRGSSGARGRCSLIRSHALLAPALFGLNFVTPGNELAVGGEAAGERKAGFVVEVEDEDARKPSTIPRSVAGTGGEAAARLRERELTARSESRVSASMPQFPFCSLFLSLVGMHRGGTVPQRAVTATGR